MEEPQEGTPTEDQLIAEAQKTGVVMYCRSWCPDCARARRWLEEKNIPFTEIDVDDDRDARAHAESLNDGRLHTPTFEIGPDVCIDFKPDTLKGILGVI
jgi:glutaredoxin